jgi:hypothetical protein
MSEADVLDEMIQRAHDVIDRLREQLHLQQRFLVELRKRRQAAAGRSAGHAVQAMSLVAGARPAGLAQVKSGSIPWHIRAILEDAGHELGLTDIANRLESRGLTTNRKGGMKAVASNSISRRLDLFQRVKTDTFDLKWRRRNGTLAND